MGIIYETYGFGKKPDKSLIVTNLETTSLNKPITAWWGSPVDCEFGWADWCRSEEFRECKESEKSLWKLKEGTKVLEIKTLEDLERIQKAGLLCRPKFSYYDCLDFKRILDAGYSAVYLEAYWMGHTLMTGLDRMFNCWDCQSIVVLDSEKIEFIEE